MKIIYYSFNELPPSKWEIKKFKLGEINLIAGVSAVGKTRLLNTIFNLGQIVTKKQPIFSGRWEVSFKIGKNFYEYILEIRNEKNRNKIKKEILSLENKKIIDRTNGDFYFDGNLLPKLGDTDIGIYLLRNEDKIREVYQGFQKIYIRRNNPEFHARTPPEPGLGLLNKELISKKKIPLKEIQEKYSPFLNIQLFLIENYYPELFQNIKEEFQIIFPFVSDLKTKMISQSPEYQGIPPGSFLPLLHIKEKGIENDIPLMNLSSGMLRALIQLIDIQTIPPGSIYLIDELENSMGPNSLSQMVDLLFKFKNDNQLIFTTHHPYVFNNVDIKYWHVLKREGNIVKVVSGEELDKDFSKSYQNKFTQLINSPLIEKGI